MNCANLDPAIARDRTARVHAYVQRPTIAFSARANGIDPQDIAQEVLLRELVKRAEKPSAIFDAPPNGRILHLATHWRLSSSRSETHYRRTVTFSAIEKLRAAGSPDGDAEPFDVADETTPIASDVVAQREADGEMNDVKERLVAYANALPKNFGARPRRRRFGMLFAAMAGMSVTSIAQLARVDAANASRGLKHAIEDARDVVHSTATDPVAVADVDVDDQVENVADVAIGAEAPAAYAWDDAVARARTCALEEKPVEPLTLRRNSIGDREPVPAPRHDNPKAALPELIRRVLSGRALRANDADVVALVAPFSIEITGNERGRLFRVVDGQTTSDWLTPIAAAKTLRSWGFARAAARLTA